MITPLCAAASPHPRRAPADHCQAETAGFGAYAPRLHSAEAAGAFSKRTREGQFGALPAAGVDRLPLTLDHSTGGPVDGAPFYGHSPRPRPTPSQFQCASLAPLASGGGNETALQSSREPVKARRRKAATLKRRKCAKGDAQSIPAADGQRKVARLTRERDEAREQQAATADVLKLISRSTFDLKTVLNTLAESAARLCAADKGLIFQRDGDVLRLVANLGYSREAERYWLEHPLPVDRGSATGRAVLEGRAIHIPDVLADPEYRATRYQELAGYRSALSVPLLRDRTTIGTFSLTRDEVNPFTDKQIELVTTFADQAVIAIENTRLFEAEHQRTRELTESLEQQTATSEVLQVISSSPGDLQPVFTTMLEKAVRICDAKFGNIYRWDGEALNIIASHNIPPAFAESRGTPFRPKRGIPSVACSRQKRWFTSPILPLSHIH